MLVKRPNVRPNVIFQEGLPMQERLANICVMYK